MNQWQTTDSYIESEFFNDTMTIDCPQCNFRWGHIKIRDLLINQCTTEFICKRYQCCHQWNIAITKEQQEKMKEVWKKVVLAKKLIAEAKEILG